MRFITGDWIADTTENTIINVITQEETKLEPIMLRALSFFAVNSNKTVSHQELIDSIWHGRVVTEHVVYRVVKVLRQALAPDDKTAYIKTIPKYGYKYVASFQELEPTVETSVGIDTNKISPNSVTAKKPKKLLYLVCGIVFFIVSAAIMQNQQEDEITQFNTIKPLTTITGVEKNPVYLNAINQLFFTYQLDQYHPANVFKKHLSTGITERLTNNNATEDNLTASLDASLIAFTRSDLDTCDVILLSKTDTGSYKESTLFECNTLYTESSDLQLTNDGKKLYYIYVTAGTHQIFSHSIATGKKTQVTKLNQNESLGEFSLALSSDNSQLAFIRRPSWGRSEIGIIDTKTNKEKVVYTINQYIDSLAWSADNKLLYYIDREQYVNALSIKNETSSTVLKGLEPNLRKVYSSPLSNSVIIEKYDNYTGKGIWQVPNPLISNTTIEDKLIISSEELDVYPSYANNYDRIAFVSLRTGSQQIWIKELNGEERRVTNFTDGRSVDNLNWSLDDTLLLSSRKNEIYAINAITGEKTTYLSQDTGANYGHATWSANGEHIYFASDMSGDRQIYSLNLITREVSQLTTKGAITAFASNSPNIVFLLKEHHEGLWQFDTDNGREVLLFDDIDTESYDGVSVSKDGIYYYSTDKKIRYYKFEDKISRDIQFGQIPFIQQFSLSTDFKWFVFYTQNLTEASIIIAAH
jgi:DNA-binding winged helix-turn-helix (wHTH) protein/Tol biopolymer transport system component